MNEILINILTSSVILVSIGLILGFGLIIAYKVLNVPVNEKAAKIREVLPGANCGACGFPGCDAYASAVSDGTAELNACTVGGADVANKIAKIMGVSVETKEKHVARVMCNGRSSVSVEKYKYQGINDCFAASKLFGGPKACTFGCLGLGNCVRACPFDAIVIVNGVAKVIEEKCRSCKKCITVCPKNLIEMVPYSKKYAVLCKSLDKGNITRKNCEVGCIGCRKCLKACEYGAIEINGFLASINAEKCTNCGECYKVCPTMAIRKMDYNEENNDKKAI